MANVYTEDRLIDTNRRALLKITGTLDSDMSDLVVVDASTLGQAMNANNLLMVSNTHPKSLYRVSVSRIWGDTTIDGYLTLQFDGDDNLIQTISTGAFNMDLDGVLAGDIDNDVANTTGDITLSGVGIGANDSYTIYIDMRKDPRDFNYGQLNDPAAFNYGDYGIV